MMRTAPRFMSTPMISLRSSIAIAMLVFLVAGPTEGVTAYVSNEGSGTVSAIDVATDKVTATLTNAKKPRGIAVAKDGSRLYLSDQTANALVVVDLATSATVATITASTRAASRTSTQNSSPPIR